MKEVSDFDIIFIMRIMRVLICLFLTLLLTVSVFSDLGSSIHNFPETRWKQLETDHFIIIYPEELRDWAEDAALAAEDSFRIITESLKYIPSEKITLSIKDYGDYANGMTNPVYGAIEVWTTPADFPARGRNEWLTNVISHELAHMVSISKTGGLYEFLRLFFGRIIMPNAVQPNWFHEGVAQYFSSKCSGEKWDSHRDMILRMNALEKNTYSYDELSNDRFYDWLGGEAYYQYGFGFVKHIADKYGEDKIEKILKQYGESLTFFLGFDYNLGDALQTDVRYAYFKWLSEKKKEYREFINNYENKFGRDDSVKITNSGWRTFSPRISSDGKKIAFTHGALNSEVSLYIAEVPVGWTAGGTVEPKKIIYNVNRTICWSSDGKKIAYSKNRQNLRGAFYNDLYVYDNDSGREERITYEERASSPAFSPDGREIVYIRNAGGTNSIRAINLETKKTEEIARPEKSLVYYSPKFSKTDRKIIYSFLRKNNSGIGIINLSEGANSIVIEDSFSNRDPVLLDGNAFLFSSDRTGIFNIYLITEEGKMYQLTSVIGGAFQPDYDSSNKRIFFASYSSKGYDVSVKDYNTDSAVPVAYETLNHIPSQDSSAEKNKSAILGTASDYNPFLSMRPKYWYPDLWGSPLGLRIGAGAFLIDGLSKNELTVSANYSPFGSYPAYNIQYQNRFLYPWIIVSTSREMNTKDDTTSTETFLSTITARVPLYDNFMFSLGYDFNIKNTVWANGSLDRSNHSKITTELEYQSVTNEGRADMIISYDMFNKLFGSIVNQGDVRATGMFVYNLPLPRNYLLFNAALGYSTSPSGLSVGSIESIKDVIILNDPAITRYYGDKSYRIYGAYKFPVIPEVGIEFWNIYLSTISIEVFLGLGNAWYKPDEFFKAKTWVGAEIRSRVLLFYGIPIENFFGVTYENPEAGMQLYWFLSFPTEG